MLIDGQCSIYEHRPNACRIYDCRIFPASGLALDDADKVQIAERARRWRFSYPTEADRQLGDAVRAAATVLRGQTGRPPDRAVPTNTTQLAVRAIEAVRVELVRTPRTERVDRRGGVAAPRHTSSTCSSRIVLCAGSSTFAEAS